MLFLHKYGLHVFNLLALLVVLGIHYYYYRQRKQWQYALRRDYETNYIPTIRCDDCKCENSDDNRYKGKCKS